MTLDRLASRIAQGCGRIAGLLFLVAMLATVYEVAMRYLFDAPTIWAHELTILLCGIGYLLAGSLTLDGEGHIAITLLYDRTSGRLRRGLTVFVRLAALTYFVLLAWSAHRRAWISLTTWEGTGTAWNPPIPAILMPLLTVVAALLALQVLARLIARRAD